MSDSVQKEEVFMEREQQGKYRAIPERDLTADTCRNYGVTVDGDTVYLPYPTGIQCRVLSEKKFWVHSGPITGLFGQDKFPSGGRYVTITEGAFDAMAAFQMFGGKYPVVATMNAQGAVKACQAAFEWLNSFDTVVLAFDADEPGQQAAKGIASLFPDKCKIVKLTKGKDANEYLMKQLNKEFVDSWWNAEKYTPEGIINGADLWEELQKPRVKALVQYPFSGLNELTYGIRPKELVMVCAGSGIGKSQFLRELVWQVLNKTEEKVGLLFLEEDKAKTAESLMSLAANMPLHLREGQYTKEEYRGWYDQALGHRRVEIFDSFAFSDIDGLVRKVREMVRAQGCRVVVLDHISIIVSSQAYGDERKAIDEVMTKLRMLVQETGICLIAVSHLRRPEGKGHEEGAVVALSQLRGSGSIGQLSDIVIGLERDGQADNAVIRNTTFIRVLKNRFCGLTGPAGSAYYNPETGRMIEAVEEVL